MGLLGLGKGLNIEVRGKQWVKKTLRKGEEERMGGYSTSPCHPAPTLLGDRTGARG